MLQVGTDTVDVYRLDELLVLRVMYSERDVVTAEVEDGLMTELKTAVIVVVLVVTLVATSAIAVSHNGIQ